MLVKSIHDLRNESTLNHPLTRGSPDHISIRCFFMFNFKKEKKRFYLNLRNDFRIAVNIHSYPGINPTTFFNLMKQN